MSARALFIATRPWSFPVTIAPVLLGSAVALRSDGGGSDGASWASFVLAMLGALCVHAVGNLVNTLEDFRCGVDRADNGAADRALVDKIVTPGQLRALIFATAGTGLACMVALGVRLSHLPVKASGQLSPVVSLVLLVLFGLFLAYAYTGWPLRLKYHRLGDIVILVAFGPLLSVGACFVHTASLNATAAYLAFPLALLTEAVLHANNARDIRVDLAAGVQTLANSLGFERSFVAFKGLYAGAFLSLPLFALAWRTPAFLLPMAMLTQLGPLFVAFRDADPDGPARTKKTDGDASSSGPKAATSPEGDICEQCGKFSAGFGILLAVAVMVA